MKRRGLLLWAGFLGATATGAVLWALGGPEPDPVPVSQPIDPDTRRRLANVAYARPELDRDQALEMLRESDALLSTMSVDEVQDLIQDQQASDAEIAAYYEEHRALFGNRSLETARERVERMVKIEQVLEQLQR